MLFGEEWDGDGEMRVWIRALWGVSRCGMESIEIGDEFLSTIHLVFSCSDLRSSQSHRSRRSYPIPKQNILKGEPLSCHGQLVCFHQMCHFQCPSFQIQPEYEAFSIGTAV